MKIIEKLVEKHLHDFPIANWDANVEQFVRNQLRSIIKQAYDAGSADGYAECYSNYHNTDYEK